MKTIRQDKIMNTDSFFAKAWGKSSSFLMYLTAAIILILQFRSIFI